MASHRAKPHLVLLAATLVGVASACSSTSADGSAATPTTVGSGTASATVGQPGATANPDRPPGNCPNPAQWKTKDLASVAIVPGINAIDHWKEWIDRVTGGVVLYPGNSGLEAGALSSEPDPKGISPFVAIDYEGGLVMRAPEIIGEMPSPRDQATTMTPAAVQAEATARARAMRANGITVDLAPDVDLDLGSKAVGSRSYGSDPATVITYAGAFADGLRAGGVVPTLKHFPGHGSANGDTHKDDAVTDPWEIVSQRDVPVYTALLAQPGPWMVMMGHLVVPGLSSAPGLPASLDPAAYRALRETTGFAGPVITDDVTLMRAVSDQEGPDTAVVTAFSAGADLVMMSDTSRYGDAVDALREWGEAAPANRDRLVASAMRTMSVMPCAADPRVAASR